MTRAKGRGRKPQGEEPMSKAEKQKAYRIRENDGGYSGTVL